MSLPLQNIKVLEFTHAVMGPTTGLLLADMGAEVIHIEPTQGDETRRLKGFGTGYFPFYNRNKKSLAIDIKSKPGQDIIYQMVEGADVVVENFGPGTMDRLGFGYDKLKTLNDKIIYCSLKGFASGPYQNRHAMDEVVQMMGGLAYMTGRPGDPLRAGTSIVDITGGMFGYIGANGIAAASHFCIISFFVNIAKRLSNSGKNQALLSILPLFIFNLSSFVQSFHSKISQKRSQCFSLIIPIKI